ncbi:hypothetical protein [Mycobacterium bourgelatii]|uniref:hypothetical protein n=1 Tax=Mycobacterium bourgelatii TaxID=1273442 RepID=UPI0013D25184|nr:hypothetical protein [Mycobacterium bourgelatii]
MSQQQMVKPVPPKRPVCKCGGGRVKVDVLIWGDLGASVLAPERLFVRAALTGQKAECADVPGRAERWELMFRSGAVDVAVAANPPAVGQMMWRDW